MNAALKRTPETMSVVAKPFFKAVGGKRQLLPDLRKHVPERFGRYFEPFVGGGALFFDLLPKAAVLNDSNPHMMAAYRAVRDDLPKLLKKLRPYVDGYADTGEEFYYERRAHQPDPASEPIETGAWFLFLNRTCFNGLWRVNKSGRFNVPHGRYENPTICDEPTLRAASYALASKKIQITCVDFEAASVNAVYGDFAYFDPPYVPASATADFTAYSKDPFRQAEQERLRDVARTLKRRGVQVLLSNADVPLVRKLYANGFEMRRVEARRAVNSDATKRGKVGELLIW